MSQYIIGAIVIVLVAIVTYKSGFDHGRASVVLSILEKNMPGDHKFWEKQKDSKSTERR